MGTRDRGLGTGDRVVTPIRRPLSSAEQVYLERLNTNLIHAQRTMEAAVDFLREQHEAQAADGWRLEDLSVGFVREYPSPSLPVTDAASDGEGAVGGLRAIERNDLPMWEKDPGED